jgi:hypothetical protein
MRWRNACGGWAARVLGGYRPLGWPPGQRRPGVLRAAAAVLVVLASVTAATSCAGAARPGQQSHARLAARTRLPASETSVLAGAADVVARNLAQELFISAPVVIVASPDRSAELTAAARSALRAHAPLLLASARAGGPAVSAILRARIKALDPRAVLAGGGGQECARGCAAGHPGGHRPGHAARDEDTPAPGPPGAARASR